jgi:polyisoprenoid-binding protein YceI
MKKLAIALFLTAVSLSTFAQTSWKSDPMHSQLKFDISHMGINTVSGSFTDFQATVVSSQADFSDAKIEMTAQANSINTGIDPRNNHLKSADFFDAEKFPTLHFETTSLKKTGKNQYKLTGNLTMHGVTKPVTLDLTYRGTVPNPRSKKDVAGFHLVGEIKRSDFGIGDNFTEPMLGETVSIVADGEFSHD